MTQEEEILGLFYEMITESKQEMFDKIASDRTKYITVVLETIMKEHNASAVLRTCDCFGIQDLHVVESNTSYEIQREIARGAGNWVDMHIYSDANPTVNCLSQLKEKGYKIVATSPHAEMDISELSIDEPIALVFGTEREGITREASNAADELVKIPMYGFTESFNISVSAAIALNILRNKLNNSELEWKLSSEEQTLLKTEWCSKIVYNGDKVKDELRRRVLSKE